MILLLFLALATVPPVLLLPIFARRWPDVSSSRLAIASAAVVPGLLLLVDAALVVHVLLIPSDQCGIDFCGMEIAAALMALEAIAALFPCGFLVAFGVARLAGRRERNGIDETFK